MKRRFSLILAVVLALSLVAVIPFATMASDNTNVGNVETGYTPEGTAVATPEEFAAMDANGKYYLANDITISATYANDFAGTFDGNGKTVTVSAPLFKNLKGTVKNLKIAGNVTVSGYDAGALAQRADNATVSNVLNSANVTGSTTVIALAESEYYYFKNLKSETGTNHNTYKLAGTGGLVGSATGVCTFANCLNRGDVNGSPAGGIVGVMGYDTDASSFTFTNCRNEGKITDVGTDVTNMPRTYVKYYYTGIGGIAGFAVDFKTIVFDSCSNKGTVLSTLDATASDGSAIYACAGGIFGGQARHTNTNTNEGASVSFTSCVNDGPAGAKYNAGGITGGTYDGIAADGTTFTNCTNNAEITNVSSRAAGIAGECSKATFTNCANNGKITGTIHLGGMVGRAYGVTTYTDCTNNGVINGIYEGGSYHAATGGLVGYISSNITLTNCKNTANVSNPNGASVGGIIGNVSASDLTATLTNCDNSGNVTAKNNAGGISGFTEGPLNMTNCKNTGESVIANFRVGGLMGRASGTNNITHCVNYADVTATGVDENTTYAGGIAGSGKTGVFADCINYGDVTATTGGYGVGGIVGYYGAKNGGGEAMIRCGNHGTISNLGAQTGGLCGYVYGGSDETTIEFCYNVANITGLNSVSGAIGYVNTSHVTVKNCFFAGTYTATKETGFSSVVNYNTNYTTAIENIYYSESIVADAQASGTAGIVQALAPTVTDAQFASGEIAYILNTAMKAADATITSDVFFQTLGTDAYPVLDNTHKAVVKNEDGSYANATEPVTPPEVTTPGGDNTTTEPDVTTTVPDVTTTVPNVTTTVPDVTTTVPGGDVTTTVPADNDTTTVPADDDTTTAPVDTTTEEPAQQTTTEKPVDTTEAPKKSCGGFALAAQLVALLGTALTVVVIKKKA